MKKLFLNLILAAGLTASLNAQGTLVAPNGYENKDAALLSAAEPFNNNNPARFQELYAASQFVTAMPNGGWISGISFRLDSTEGHNVSVQVNNLEIRLSTSQRGPNSIGGAFADNVGADELVVLPPTSSFVLQSGHGGNPNPFSLNIPFATPFFYNPESGNLVVDFMVHTPFRIGAGVDSVGNGQEAVGVAFGALSSSRAVLSGEGGYITQFQYQAVPEPTTTTMLALAGMFAFIYFRRIQRA